MTKTELQSALAEATQTDKRTAGVFLDTLSALAYKEIKKNGEFVLPGFGKLVKQKRKARTCFKFRFVSSPLKLRPTFGTTLVAMPMTTTIARGSVCSQIMWFHSHVMWF
jgi:Bacterial DNA-binding protein